MKPNPFLSSRVQTILFAAGLTLAVPPASLKASPAPLWMQGGHAARITGVACSPGGSMIASASEDGTVKLWSTNGTLLRTLNTQPYASTALAWSPDGTKIAAGTYYGGYINSKAGAGLSYLWQAPSGWTSANVSLVRMTTNRYGKVTALAFSADSTRLASGCAAGSNSVNSVTDGSVVVTCPAYNTSVRPAAVTSVAFSTAGLMASGCEDATIRVYDSSSWSQLWSTNTAHTTNVTAVAFSPNGLLLATASLDSTIKIWSTNDWTCQRTLSGNTNGIVTVGFSPDGQKLVSGSLDGTVQIWNQSSGECLVTIAAHALPVTATVFSTDGTRVISGSDDGTVRMWSAADGSAVCTLGSQNYFIGAVVVSPDGTLCASAGGDAAIQVRNLSDGSLVQTLIGNTNYVSSLAFSPDSARLASGGGPLDPTIKLWRISDGTNLVTIQATTNGVMALAWSPDGLTLAAGGDSVEQNITFWDTNGVLQGSLPGTLSAHTNGVTALAFSPQGNLLATGGRRPGNLVRIWTNNIPGIWTTGVVVRSFASSSTNNNVECVTFSPDGTKVAYGSTAVGVLKVGLISDGSCLTNGTGTDPVFSVAFSPDGSTLAATDQHTIQFWLTNGSAWVLLGTATQEVVRASCLASSPNGNQLLCGREDGTVTLLPYSLADFLVTVGAASNPSPTNGASGIALHPTLSWTPGSNALTHAVYLGSSSNAVAQATPASPEYQGVVAGNSFAPALVANSTYYWRVDELAGLSTTAGGVWSFTTAPLGLIHRYSFSETGGTAVTDSVGGSSWNGTLPNGGTFSGGQLTLASNASQYVSLPAGIVSTLSDFTIEVWAKLNSAATGVRFFDFGDNTTNYMLLTPQSGSTGKLRFAIRNPSNADQEINGPNALSAGVTNHLAVTLNGNTGILYLNGAAVGTNSAMTLRPSSLGSTTRNWLGRSEFSNPYLNGVFDEFRVYNVALSPAEIAATDALGPSQTLSANSPSISLAATNTNLTLTWPLTAAGFTLQSRTNVADGNWVNVSSPAPQIVGTNLQVTLAPANTAQFFRLSR